MTRSSAWMLIIPIIVACAYAPSRSGPFAYDDRIHILENESVIHFRSLLDPDSLRRIRDHAFGLASRPLLFITYGMNYSHSGANPTAFRFTNYAIHVANSLLVFWIVLELARILSLPKSNRFKISLIAGALFAAHPLLTESVTYIAGRSSSLCATFYFAALFVILRAGRAKGFKQLLLVLLALVLTAFAWLVKQDAVTAPLAMIALMWIAWPGSAGVAQKVRATVLTTAFLLLTLLVQVRSISTVQSNTQGNEALVAAGFEQTVPLKPYVLTSIEQVTTYYLWRMIVPIRLSVDPDPAVIESPFTASFLFSAGVLLGLAGLTVWMLRRDRLLASGLALMLLSPLGPYCFFPLADVVAEHRAYISVVGAVIVMAAVIARFSQAVVISSVVVIAFMWLTVNRNEVWKDEGRLWEDAAAKAPAKQRPHLNLGALYQTTGRTADAIREYESVLKRNPAHPTALSNLASIYLANNDLPRAEEFLNRAIAGQTTFAAVYLNLGVVRLRQARFQESRELLARALTLNPRQLMVHLNLGDIHFNERHPELAIPEYLTELQLNPNSTITHLHLAKAFEATSQPAKARNHYLSVQRLDPNDKEARAALQRLH